MALPPKGDPRRPMHLAIRSCQGLGALFIILSGLFGAACFLGGRGPATRVILVMFLLVGVPGVLYVLTAVFMKRRQLWAVILGLVVSSVNALFVLLAFLGSLLNVANSPVMTIVTLLWVVALAQLIYQLAKSPAAMRADQAYQPRGFEVIQSVVPLDEKQSDA